ncbi:Hsp70 family protein [Streptomyces sp. NPDC048172]|uniref:Hsp70 family protein n=1 Tax=Streptomyces sp. NPDC048172 TaxID=3365505 RepID=UPI003718BA1B
MRASGAAGDNRTSGIRLGIDLGTASSAVAVVGADGEPRTVINHEGRDTTPTAVWIPREGVVHVGRRARTRTGSHPGDAHAGFKPDLGTAGAERRFARAGVALTPVELCAEVLRSLRDDATHRLGAPPESVVLTVPASFTLNQCAAARAAAELAGLGPRCALVRDPVAAALAHEPHAPGGTGQWLVLDLGGGTFDAAVVTRRDGVLRVRHHAGDPYLGGRDLDRAVVDTLLAPAVARGAGLAGFSRDNPAWHGNFARLGAAAEEARVRLSRQDTVRLVAELGDGAGGVVPFEHTLTRGALDDVAAPFYARAVRAGREALAEGGLAPDDLDGLLCVGGATQAPGLRELLADPAEGLGVLAVPGPDPLTAVAHGAALLAEEYAREYAGEYTREYAEGHAGPRALRSADAPVLPHSLGIGLPDGSFAPLLRKGSVLPATGTRTYRTPVALRRDGADTLRIPVVEGERDRVERNTTVGSVEIRAREGRAGLPERSDVDVTFEIGADHTLSVRADVPLARARFTAEGGLAPVRPPGQAALECLLREAGARLARLRAEAEDAGIVTAARRLARLATERLPEDARDRVRAAAGGEPGAAAGAAAGLLRLQVELDAIEGVLRVPLRARELRELLAECEDQAASHGDTDDRQELDHLCAHADTVLRGWGGDRGGNDDVHAGTLAELLDRARELRVRLLGKGGDWETTRFLLLCDARDAMASRGEADALIARGRHAVRTGGGPELREISDRLTRLLPQDVSGGARTDETEPGERGERDRGAL